jgi:uncharacterized protein (UPF0332 family)
VKETTRLLLDKADRAVHAAEVLREAGEAEFAAGRVYYAMRHVAEALLFERGLVFRKHTAVQAAFGREFAKTGELDAKFHRWLLTASDLRLQGDYQAQVHVTDEDVETGLAQAKEFLTAATLLLEAVPPLPAPGSPPAPGS